MRWVEKNLGHVLLLAVITMAAMVPTLLCYTYATQSTMDGTSSGAPANDCFGTKTASAGTAIVRALPPRAGQRLKVGSWHYSCGSTSHTLSFLTCVSEHTVSTEAASGQAVVNISSIPTDPSGGALANTDFFVLKYEDGTWEPHQVSSASGTAITVAANFTKKIPAGSKAYNMAAPGDHSDRQLTMPASTNTVFYGGDNRITACTAAKNDQPILVHSNNATAQGWLTWVSYLYVPEP